MDTAAEQGLRHYLLYRNALVPLGDVRQTIVDTFGYAPGPTFILGNLSGDPDSGS